MYIDKLQSLFIQIIKFKTENKNEYLISNLKEDIDWNNDEIRNKKNKETNKYDTDIVWLHEKIEISDEEDNICKILIMINFVKSDIYFDDAIIVYFPMLASKSLIYIFNLHQT